MRTITEVVMRTFELSSVFQGTHHQSNVMSLRKRKGSVSSKDVVVTAKVLDQVVWMGRHDIDPLVDPVVGPDPSTGLRTGRRQLLIHLRRRVHHHHHEWVVLMEVIMVEGLLLEMMMMDRRR